MTSARLVLLAVAFFVSTALCAHGSPVAKMASLPMYFESNEGQTDPAVRYLSHGRGYALYLSPAGAVLAVSHSELDESSALGRGVRDGTNHSSMLAGLRPRGQFEAAPSGTGIIRMELVGGDSSARMTGLAELAGKVNYFRGNDPTRWRTNIATYSKVQYQQVYPGIDLIFYGSSQQELEYDFVVAPGADPNQIKLGFAGAERVELADNGDLVLHLGDRQIRQRKPRLYQQVNGGEKEIPGGYVLREDTRLNASEPAAHSSLSRDGKVSAASDRVRVGFTAAAYDRDRALIIDPVLAYSTFIGGSGSDVARGIAVDDSGSAYIVGTTDSPNFPTNNPIREGPAFPGDRDAFVIKLNPQGSGFVYATYLGGSSGDNGNGIAVDADANTYVVGDTGYSTDFPMVNAFQSTSANCVDAFLAKLSNDGSQLLYSTKLGGNGCEGTRAVAVGTHGLVWLAGNTSSTDFPTRNALQPGFQGGGPNNPYNYKGDAFVAKIDTTAVGPDSLVYSTYLGGSDDDVPNGIAVDAAGNAYVAGYTASTNFPTPAGVYQPSFAGGDYDVFVAKLDPSGTALVYSTYLGGSGNDNNGNGGGCIALDKAGNAFVTGQTGSLDFPTTNAWQPTMTSRWRPGLSGNGFVSKVNPDGSALVYSTFLWGVGYTAGVAVDQAGSVHVAGMTMVGDFPTVNAIQANHAGGSGWDGCVLKLDPDGQSARYATYLGGDSYDGCNGIAVGIDGAAYIIGSTASTNFPIHSGIQAAFGGGSEDGFVVKISDPDTNPPVILAASNYGDAAVVTVDFSEALDLASASNATHYTLDQGVTISSATMGINSRTVRLLTTGLTNGVTYTLMVNGVLDRAPVPNPIAPDTHVAFTALRLFGGFLRQEVYTGINSDSLSDLTNQAKFPNQPDLRNEVHQFEILSGETSQSGSRLTGYLIPPVTGDYTFYVCTERQGALFLSRNESPLNAVQIALEPMGIAGHADRAREWNHPVPGFPVNPLPNLSLPVHLEAGRAYYLEALAQSGGGNLLGVTWRVPGQPAPQNGDPPIAGNFLAVLADPRTATLAIIQEPQDATVGEGQTAAFSVKVMASPADVYYQWRKNGNGIPGVNGASYITSEASLAGNGDRYDCVLTVPGATATTRSAVLTVTNDVTPAALVSAEGNLTGTHITLTFSEPINLADATNAANYTLSGGLVVSNAVLLLDRRTVILTTSPQTPGSNYTVQVSGVRDCSSAGNTVAPGTQASCYGWVDEEFVGPFPSWANVKLDYGAVGDGVADDTAALQQALNEVATAGHAAVLYFPTGTYRITRTLDFSSRLSASLIGEDPVSTIIKWYGPTNADMMFANAVAYCRWTRLTWDGSGQALGAVHHGFTSGLYQVTGNTHTDEVFKDLSTGLYADPASGGDSHLVVRCQFVRCFNGIAVGSYNAIDWHVWDSVFEDCSFGLHSYAGNFHSYRSLFLRSVIADIHCDDTYYGIRGNMSIGSRTFVEGGAPMTIQGNTVIDSLEPVSIQGSGPMILLDNIIKSRAGATNGPVVDVDANLLSAGNTFTLQRAKVVAGRSITMEDQIVNRDFFDLPPLMIPAFLPKVNRPIIEVTAGTNAVGIQQAIDAAASLNGSRPVVHLPAGNYYLDRTLTIPAGCDLQLVGDGYIGRGTTLNGGGPGGSPVLRLAGPSKATLRELQITGGRSALGLVIDNCDQPGARVFSEKLDLGDNDISNLVVDRLDHTEVRIHDFFHGQARAVSVRVVGGAAQASGQSTSGHLAVFGGGTAINELTYQVEHGGRLMIQDCWYEGHEFQRFMRLSDSGQFILNNAVVAGSDANPGGNAAPLIQLDDFRGQVSFLQTAFRFGMGSDPILVKGDGALTDLLLVGCSGVNPSDTPWLVNQSPNAHVTSLFPASGQVGSGGFSSHASPDLGDDDPVFLGKMLSRVRTEVPGQLVPISPGITDVRIFRVSITQCTTAMKLMGTNAPPQLVPTAAEYVVYTGTTLTLTNQVIDADLPFDSFTFTLGPGAPANMFLNPTNGVLSWTPIESQGFSTNQIQIIIGDDGSPRLFVTNAITISVLASNLPPALGVGGVTTNVGLEGLVNIELPGVQRLPPSWESPGGGSFDIYAGGNFFYYDSDDSASFAYRRVTGDFDARVRLAGFDPLHPETRAGLMIRETLDSYSRTLHVLAQPSGVTEDGRLGYGYFETIQRHSIGGRADRWDSGYGGGAVTLPHAWMRLRRQSQTFTAYWSDDGVNWNQIGQHHATPVYPLEVYVGLGMDSGNNLQNAHFEFRDFQNVESTLVAIPDAVVNEGERLALEVKASDLNLPAQALTFSLDAGAPAGATIDPVTGVFTWTPTFAQGPSTNQIVVRVTDDGVPPLSTASSFSVVVREVNFAPTMAVIPAQRIDELTLLTVTNTASEANVHATVGYTLFNPPVGMAMDTNGVITWIPSEAQGPGTNVITTVATSTDLLDLVNPTLSATNSFTIVVNEVNTVPVLAVPATQTVNELVTLSVSASAIDSDIPVNPLIFALVSAPTGMTINPNSGLITWTPSQAQSPSTNLVQVSVTDSNPPAVNAKSLSVTNSFTVIVREVNQAPVLPLIPTQTVNELALLTVTNTAAESNIHSTLGYVLVNPPFGMVIDANGVITWTPQQNQSPSTNLITTIVTNSNPYDLVNPYLSATNMFTVIVKEVNVAPVLPVIPTQTVNELTLLTVTNTATESNIHSTLAYVLANSPAGMVIDANGIITWTPQQSQSPSTNLITTVVTNSNPYDLDNPHLGATNSFTVIVKEVNVAPVLPVIPTQTVNELTLLTVTNTATEPNIHSTPGYALVNPPSGMSIDANGVITWTPSEAQGPGTNIITTAVTSTDALDPINPELSATNSFTVVVNEVNTTPVIGVINDTTVSPGQTVGLAVPATDSDLPTNSLAFALLASPPGMTINAASGWLTWRPTVAQANSTNLMNVQVTDDNPWAINAHQLSATQSFRIIVNPLAPVTLQPLGYTNESFCLSVSGPVGPDYILQGSSNLHDWLSLASNAPLALPFTVSDTNTATFPNRFYRVRLGP